MKKVIHLLIYACLFLFQDLSVLEAQSLQGTISSAISKLIIILNLLIVGAIAWAGFLLVKGESSGVSRLLYCVVALIVVNSAQVIMDFFRF